MKQQGQVFELKTRSHGGEAVWAYRYRIAGRGSRRRSAAGSRANGSHARRLSERSRGYGTTPRRGCGVSILVSRLRIGHFKPDSGPQRPRCRDDQPLSFSA